MFYYTTFNTIANFFDIKDVEESHNAKFRGAGHLFPNGNYYMTFEQAHRCTVREFCELPMFVDHVKTETIEETKQVVRILEAKGYEPEGYYACNKEYAEDGDHLHFDNCEYNIGYC